MSWVTTSHAFLELPNGVLGVYNSHDAYNTARLVGPLLEEMRDRGQLEAYAGLVEPLLRPAIDMQRAGLMLDVVAAGALHSRLSDELREIDGALRGHAYSVGFSPQEKFTTSKPQLAEFLYGHCELKAPKRTEKTGRASVDQDSLTRTLRGLRKKDEPHRQFILDLFHRSRLHTIKTRYLKLYPDSDGRVRASVKLAGTKTWRYAYESPALQQFPAECRYVFTATPGMVLVAADYSQLEARLLAYQAGAKRLMETFESGGDVHRLNAQDLFGVSDEGWAAMDPGAQKKFRNMAKTFFYRKVYGGTIASGDKKLFCPCQRCADKVPDTVNLSRTAAVEAEERWGARNPEVQEYQDEVARFVKRNSYLELVLGGRRYISKPWGHELARELANIPHQMGAARVMARAQIRLHRAGLRILLQHHDAFVFELQDHPAAINEAMPEIRAIMEDPVPIKGRMVKLPVDLSLGYNWGDWDVEKNPRGLRPWQG